LGPEIERTELDGRALWFYLSHKKHTPAECQLQLFLAGFSSELRVSGIKIPFRV
jgi:hypothetical protein